MFYSPLFRRDIYGVKLNLFSFTENHLEIHQGHEVVPGPQFRKHSYEKLSKTEHVAIIVLF